MSDQNISVEVAAPVIEVRRMAVITIFVSDMERSLRFYKEMLGFAEGEQMLSPGVTIEAGEIMLYLVADRQAAERPLETYPEISLCFAVPGARDAFAKLRDAGAVIVGEYNEPSEYFASFRIADPDGNLLQFWGRP